MDSDLIIFSNKCKNCGKPYFYNYNAFYERCEPCLINQLKKNFAHWSSGNEKIDALIQEMQLKNYSNYFSVVFEWIQYNQFKEVKKIDNDCLIALWKDGPLRYYDEKEHKEYVRSSDEYVTLKYLCNSESITDEFLYEV